MTFSFHTIFTTPTPCLPQLIEAIKYHYFTAIAGHAEMIFPPLPHVHAGDIDTDDETRLMMRRKRLRE